MASTLATNQAVGSCFCGNSLFPLLTEETSPQAQTFICSIHHITRYLIDHEKVALPVPFHASHSDEHFLFTTRTTAGGNQQDYYETPSDCRHNWCVSSLATGIVEELQDLLHEWTGVYARLWSGPADQIWASIGPLEVSGTYVYFGEPSVDAEQALLTLCNQVYLFCVPHLPANHSLLPSASPETAYWQSKAF